MQSPTTQCEQYLSVSSDAYVLSLKKESRIVCRSPCVIPIPRGSTKKSRHGLPLLYSFTSATQAQAQATCEPGRPRHKHKRAFLFPALVPSRYTRGLCLCSCLSLCLCLSLCSYLSLYLSSYLSLCLGACLCLCLRLCWCLCLCYILVLAS